MICEYFSAKIKDRIKVEKFEKEKDVSFCGAFSKSSVILLKITVPNILGINSVKASIQIDGCKATKKTLKPKSHTYSTEIYEFSMNLSELCRGAEVGGLVFYEFSFADEYGILYTDTVNNYDFKLKRNAKGTAFHLLINEDGQKVPEWFCGSIMYHIFVDRFCRGEGAVKVPKDALLDEEWDAFSVQYAACRGGPVENNLFFGGNLWGICEKLSYLKSLGVDVIYLSPIFKAYSNHKYDTGDYFEIDELFGGREAFEYLLKKCAEHGIKIILDGVFNHTGIDSRYFNKFGNYDSVGAYQSQDSEYRDWYKFIKYPDEYTSWWGIDILPTLNQHNEKCRNFFCGENGVGAKYIKDGIAGFRLDVADELNDEFLDDFTLAVKKASDGQGLIIGEVWENAADKMAYGKRRRYFRGGQLDSVMNYPFRNGIIDFLRYGDAAKLCNILTEIYVSYPKEVCNVLMNIIDTHDTERILTVLGATDFDKLRDLSNQELCAARLSEVEYVYGKRLLKMAVLIQYTVYGVPSVFYGSEAGIEGYRDPFCRRTFPWGREDREMLDYYRLIGQMRKRETNILKSGDFKILECGKQHIVYARKKDGQKIIVGANMANSSVSIDLDGSYKDLLTGEDYSDTIEINRKTAVVLKLISED